MSDSELQTVPQVDLKRYLGTWYEICRLPLQWQEDGSRDITATYTLTDKGDVGVDNRCLLSNGTSDQALGVAKVQNPENTKLKVSFLPAYVRWLPVGWGDYWILRLAGHESEPYQLSLVGTPDRKHLWLLSRKPQIEVNLQEDFLQTATSLGFDLAALIEAPQSGKIARI